MIYFSGEIFSICLLFPLSLPYVFYTAQFLNWLKIIWKYWFCFIPDLTFETAKLNLYYSELHLVWHLCNTLTFYAIIVFCIFKLNASHIKNMFLFNFPFVCDLHTLFQAVDTVVAGILHDVVDDTCQSLRDIEAEFGDDVVKLVASVSRLSYINQVW